MPANGQTSRTNGASQQDYQKLVRQVAERVWQLWREEARRNRERRGGKLRS